MKLEFLGSASCFPTPNRGVSCTALQLDDGQVWLFDCGEGSQIQLQKSSIKAGKITKIFITHLHGDHMFGLPGLLCTLGNGMDPTNGHNTVIELYGPLGVRKFVTNSLSLSRSPLLYKLSVIELIPKADQYPDNWDVWSVDHHLDTQQKLPQESSYREVECCQDKYWPLISDNNFVVRAAALEHRIPSFGFHIREADSPGRLNVEKIQELGIKPGPAYGKLKSGQCIEFQGRTLDPADFLGPPVIGREIVIFGDTCNSDQILGLTSSPDVFVHESTMENSLKEKCVEFGHSTPDMAADIALRAKAKMLVLFHVSPRYKPIGDTLKKDDCSAQTLLTEAKQYLESQGSAMQVDVAQDFTVIEIHKIKS